MVIAHCRIDDMVTHPQLSTNTQDDDYLFVPDSAIWQVNRERVLLLTGTRVLLMQLAHPMVAEAVYHHSYVFKNPVKRLHRTLTLTLAMVFGTRSQVQEAVSAIEAAHRPATGQLEQGIGIYDAGASYNPRNPKQALWVWATLVEGAISGYERLVAPLSDNRKDDFVADSALVGDWMGIPARYIPDSYAQVTDYMETAIAQEQVIVSEKARKIAPFVTAQSIPIVNWLSYPVHRFNMALLPDAIRTQYGYAMSDWELNLVERCCALSRRGLPYLPDIIRYAPEYRRARHSTHASVL